jgi:hypothetical protein
VGRGKSTAASSMASSQCAYDSFVVANFRVIGPYFFEDIMKCMWNKMDFNVHLFCKVNLKLK